MRPRLIRAVSAILLALGAFAAEAADQRVLVMGAIHDDPKSHYGALQPMARYMETALRAVGIEHVEILIVPNRGQMVNLLRDQRIDWVSETPFGAVQLEERAGAEMLLRKWKDGAATYRSVFFSRRDAGVTSIDDLRDRTIAFEHRNSTSAFYSPASMMLANGLPLEALATPRERPRIGASGYIFSGNEYNTAMWVALGLVDAGVLSSTDWTQNAIVPPALKSKLTIFAESRDYPRAVEVVRADLDEPVKRLLRDTLLNIHTDPAARDALVAYDQTSRFDQLTEADRDVLAGIRQRTDEFETAFR
jgi:phosphonate transport system substrate-binding protein